MTNNINVLQVLESKPNGTKLWCVLFGKCFLDGIDINNIRPIRIGIEKGDTFKLTANAKLGGKYIDGDCLLYPSKEMRDWSRFAWKKGDILISSDGGTEVIFDKWYDDTYTSFYCKHYLNSEDETKFVYYEEFLCTTERYTIEDKDKAQIYIGIIEERLGGKLNRETLEVEKAQPEFKDGDIITFKDRIIIIYNTSIEKSPERTEIYYHACLKEGELTVNEYLMSYGFGEGWYSSTEEEKQHLFDALAKKNKAWDAEKKMIVDLKTLQKFKPFDKVIIRLGDHDTWKADFYSHYCANGEAYTVGDVHISDPRYILPYEGNESLLGTANSPK